MQNICEPMPNYVKYMPTHANTFSENTLFVFQSCASICKIYANICKYMPTCVNTCQNISRQAKPSQAKPNLAKPNKAKPSQT